MVFGLFPAFMGLGHMIYLLVKMLSIGRCSRPPLFVGQSGRSEQKCGIAAAGSLCLIEFIGPGIGERGSYLD